MKKIYLFKTLLLLFALVAGSGSVWAQSTSTLNFTAACGGSGTADDGAVWTVTSDGAESNFDGTCGIHYGTNKADVTYVQLTTSDISGTITQVVVNARDAQASATVSVTVGGVAFTCTGSSTATNSSADYTFTGSGSGTIVVRVDRGEAKTKAIYVKSVVVTYTGGSSKPEADLAFSESSVTCDLYADFTEPTLSCAEGFDGTVTYTSSNVNVATVDGSTGDVTLIGVGETTITASSEVTDNFKAGTASYTLTVTKRGKVDPIAPEETDGKFVRVPDVTDLEDGKYLIVYENSNSSLAFDGSRTTLDAVSNTISVDIDDDEIAATDATMAAVFTYNSANSTLKSASGFYIGQTSNANGLASSDTEEYENTISFDANGNANIVSSSAYLRYNSASNQTRFRYYKSNSYSNQNPIQLYKYVRGEAAATTTVNLSGYGYKTLVATENFTVSEETKAYIVTDVSETSVTTQEISVVPANEPVFLKGTANAEVTLTFTDEAADDVSANLLEVSTATQGNGCYVLAKYQNEGVGFYKWAGGSLGAGRVILPESVVPSGARQFLPFNEATGIDEIVSSKPTNGEWYDLQGRRVVKAQKGLYIMNGKKVLVK